MAEYRGTIIDDDGVLVVSTKRQMLSIGAKGFDYDFPGELLAHMSAGAIVAWETRSEDEDAVEVVFADNPHPTSHGAFLLTALADDGGLVMPYSQFTYAVDCAGGVVSDRPGLAFSFPIGPGKYHVFVGLSHPEARRAFRITISPARHTLVSLGEGLPLIRAGGA